MIENAQIFDRFFEAGEKLIWSGKPYFEEITKKEKYFSWAQLIFAIGLSIFLILFTHFVLMPLSPLVIILGILGLSIFGYTMGFTLKLMSLKEALSIMLAGTEYFITDKRIFSVRCTSEGFFKKVETKQIVQVFLSDVDYFFFTEEGKLPPHGFHLNFKVTSKEEENIEKSILICRPLEDIKLGNTVQIVRDKGWKWSSEGNEFVYRLNNVVDKEAVAKPLENILNIGRREPPSDWEDLYGFMEFYDPY